MKLLILLLLLLPSLAHAQVALELSDGEYDTLASPATAEEAADLAKDANAGDAAIAAARSLVEGCAARLKRDAARQNRTLERAYLVNSTNREALDALIKQEEAKRQASHDAASKELLADLRSLLPDGSEDAWNSFERRRHRRFYLHQSGRSGVGVDLIEVARVTKLYDRPEVRELLKPYELELDRLIMARLPLITDSEKSWSEPDGTTSARAFDALRDADCTILKLQRATAQRLLALAPNDIKGTLRDKLLTSRSQMIQIHPPIRARAERLLKSNRLDPKRHQQLLDATRTFDERSRSIDESHLTLAEDQDCARSFADINKPQDNSDMTRWYEESRKIQVDLLDALEKIASEEDLDAITEG